MIEVHSILGRRGNNSIFHKTSTNQISKHFQGPVYGEPLPEEGRVGDVVVHKLSPLHDVVGVKLGGGVEVRNDGDGDETGRGELGTTHRVGLGPPNTVTVHRVQHTLQTK